MNDVYNDIFLKRYVTGTLIKRQWGVNLSKFNGVAMLGGVTLNGQQIFRSTRRHKKVRRRNKRHMKRCNIYDRIMVHGTQLIIIFKVAMGSYW